MKQFFKNWRNDLPSGLVVFLVALPLCLGVGLASTTVKGADGELMNGLPIIFSGIIAGVIGGIIVGALSGSRLGVSGPAAGLITIVTSAILTLGSFEAFLLAVMLSGVIQIIAGYLKAGVLSRYFPSSVIKGMLAAIGITLILKEIPHAFGYDHEFMGTTSFFQNDGENTLSEIWKATGAIHFGAITVSLLSIGVLILFDTKMMKKIAVFKIIPGALIVVVMGVLLNMLFKNSIPGLEIHNREHMVNLPMPENLDELLALFTRPDFTAFTNPNLYIIAFTLAIVGSLETLLSVEATDKLDPEKHHTPTNRELKAQGVGNIVSGFLGGLPITQVIVRSSANINSGAKSKLSTILHGILLMGAVLVIPQVLNLIPLASLAAILIMIGYKLAQVTIFKSLYKQGWEQFVPFISTILAVLFSDLLIGIGVGIAIAIFYILRRNYRNNYVTETIDDTLIITLNDEVTFLNKASVFNLLEDIQPNTKVEIIGNRCKNIDYDTLEILKEFRDYGAKERNIELKITGIECLMEP